MSNIKVYKGWEIGFDSAYNEYWVGRDKTGGDEYLTYNSVTGEFNIRYKAVYEQESAWYNSPEEAIGAIKLWARKQQKQPPALDFVIQIVKEAEEAVAKHGQFASCHEGYGVIKEEVDEFWDEVKKKESDRDYANMKKELVQIAAMCMKMYDFATIKEKEKQYKYNEILDMLKKAMLDSIEKEMMKSVSIPIKVNI
jgi:hypothetical protein